MGIPNTSTSPHTVESLPFSVAGIALSKSWHLSECSVTEILSNDAKEEKLSWWSLLSMRSMGRKV